MGYKLAGMLFPCTCTCAFNKMVHSTKATKFPKCDHTDLICHREFVLQEIVNNTYFVVCVCIPMQNVTSASLVQAASSHVTAQLEGHVTPGLENAVINVLQAFMEINVSWVRHFFTIAVHHTAWTDHIFLFIYFSLFCPSKRYSTAPPCGSNV